MRAAGITPCACGQPSVDRFPAGVRHLKSGPVRVWAWRCNQCATELEREREAVRRG